MNYGRSARICYRAAVVLSLAGLAVTAYLSAVSFTGHVPACGGVGDCERVTTSQYAELFGVPMAALGVAMYSLLLLGSLAAVAFGAPPRPLRRGLIAVSAAGVGFSIYLSAVETFVLRAACAYCIASATLVALLLVLTATAALTLREPHDATRLHSPVHQP